MSFTATMMLFARALSRTPNSSNQVMSITIANAGTLIEDRNAAKVRRGLEQPMDLGIAAQERRAIAGGEPIRHRHPAVQQRLEVVAPRDRDRDVADGILEDQVPPDDPRHELAERRVRVRVRAPRLRDHRRELGVAEPSEAARGAQQEERQHERRTGADTNDLAVRPHLPRRRRADRRENAGADHRPDGEHDQIAGAERPLHRERRVGLGDELADRLAAKQIGHEGD